MFLQGRSAMKCIGYLLALTFPALLLYYGLAFLSFTIRQLY